jgi:hypothetical protein
MSGNTSAPSLEQRVRRLEDIEELKRLKYRYWRCLDLKLWDEIGECFAPDARVAYGEGQYTFTGVDAILAFLREALGRERGSVTLHHGHHPEITFTGDDTARATWALDNYMFNLKQDRGVRIGAYYEDDCARIGGVWKFTSIGYRYLFHEEWRRSELSSLALKASMLDRE